MAVLEWTKDENVAVITMTNGENRHNPTFTEAILKAFDEIEANGDITAELAAQHANLIIAGLVGSIDNDLVGTDMTIGADSALHRIVDAIDDLASTAASHQRSFVVEVMGRHCGYLALMSAVAGGTADVQPPVAPSGL